MRLLFSAFAFSALVSISVEAEKVLEATGVRSGLAVHVGSTDGQLEAGLAKSGALLIQGITSDPAHLAKARKTISKSGCYGIASVIRVADFKRLPYANDMVNLLIADLDELGVNAPTMLEIRRVLAPLGMAWLKRDRQWSRLSEPVPEDVDEWHHWDHGAGGNPFSQDKRIAPTTSLRWLAGATNADRTGAKVGLRISDGHVFYTGINYDADGSARKGRRNDIFARNAFNGILSWKQPIDGVPGGGDTPPRFALTAKDGRVYCYPKAGEHLQALDATTGKTLVTFSGGPVGPSISDWNKWKDPVSKIHYIVRVIGDRVMQTFGPTIFLSDAKTGHLLWKKNLGKDAVVGWAVSGSECIFAAVADQPLIKNRASPITPASRIVALRVKDGAELWSYADLPGHALFRMIYFRNSVIVPAFPIGGKSNFAKNPTVVRLNASDGKVIWRSNPKAGTRGHYPIVMARGNEVIIGQQGGFGVDFETGKLTRYYNWGQTSNSCADLKCVPNYTMYGMTFIDREGKRTQRGQTRTVCDVGLFPAYGLLYGSPLGCLCSEYINGYTALSSAPLAAPLEDHNRLEKGSIYSEKVIAKWERKRDEWPMFMADPRRSSSSQHAVAENLELLWEYKVRAGYQNGPLSADWVDNEKIVGLVTAPSVASGKVFVAAPDAHRLDALDAISGKLVWSFTAGARIDSPPTVMGSHCIFGCRDGYVYALRASDGVLVWRFFAARNRRQIGVYSQLESAWPVFGSILPDSENIVFGAGRQSAVDGGIIYYKLRAADGSYFGRHVCGRILNLRMVLMMKSAEK